MNLEFARNFLLCCLVVNYGVLLVWFAAFAFARRWMYRLHSCWFRLSEESFDSIHYAGMAVYKIGILLFNLAPYVALHFLASPVG